MTLGLCMYVYIRSMCLCTLQYNSSLDVSRQEETIGLMQYFNFNVTHLLVLLFMLCIVNGKRGAVMFLNISVILGQKY